MTKLAGLETLDGRALFRPVGSASAWQLSDLISAALVSAHAARMRDILIDISSARREHICPGKTGLLVLPRRDSTRTSARRQRRRLRGWKH
jgi:hypothetical protein